MIRRLIWFILSVIVAAILFIILIAFFPSKKKSVDIVNMSYVFIDDDWTEYDVFKPVHWSAVDWSFLFKKDYVWETEVDTWETIHQTSEEWITQEEVNEVSNIDPNNPFNLPEWAIEQPLYKDCETPWWIIVKHNESILAYEQRKDVPDICNVQKRRCNNGVLDWTFKQPSCNETVVYSNWSSSSKSTVSESSNLVSYTKKQVISYNDSAKSDLIQTPKYTKNEWAEYDKNWKLKKGNEQPKSNWSNNDPKWESKNYNSEEQINVKHYNCKTPWWEIVQHGQFVKAYELPFWFTNASCEIELRLCVDWELLWSFWYKECKYLDVTYEEYNNSFEANEDIQHRVASEKHWLLLWIESLFN